MPTENEKQMTKYTKKLKLELNYWEKKKEGPREKDSSWQNSEAYDIKDLQLRVKPRHDPTGGKGFYNG